MSDRDELEDRMMEAPTRADLGRYADLLIAENDPRGELIALDLRGGLERVSLRRRTELLEQLLGPSTFEWYRRSVSFSFGLVAEVTLGMNDPDGNAAAAALLEGPFGAYVCSITIRGNKEQIVAAVAQVASRARRWLTQLQFDVRLPVDQPPIIDPEMTSALIAATPQLSKLIVTSDVPPRPVFQTFSHAKRPAIDRYVRPAVVIAWQ